MALLAALLAGASVHAGTGGAAAKRHRATARVQQDSALYSGLPERLPGDYLSQKGFLPFDRDDGHDAAPIFSLLMINGERVQGGIFTEKLWVRLPEGSRISTRVSNGVEVWRYPVGTESLHEIRFDAPSSDPFELRIVRLLSEDRWAFGAYRFQGGQWTLNTATSASMESARIQLRGEASPSKIEFKRINVRSCQACHHMNAVKEQFPTRERTGPCAFVSWNPTLLEGWAREFERRLGYFPITRE